MSADEYLLHTVLAWKVIGPQADTTSQCFTSKIMLITLTSLVFEGRHVRKISALLLTALITLSLVFNG